jgi:hypothetical protein
MAFVKIGQNLIGKQRCVRSISGRISGVAYAAFLAFEQPRVHNNGRLY